MRGHTSRTSDWWRRVEELFESVRRLSPGERAARLDLCPDEELRREVESLLAQDIETFLEVPVCSPREEEIGPGSPPSSMSAIVPGYRIVGSLGRGGMGAVYRAESEDEPRRSVAIKFIHPRLDVPEFAVRFERERNAMAILDHPNIARALESGRGSDGQPYVVVEYVPGSTLGEHCDRRALGVRERLEVFRDVCRGVEHAHRKGVLHRDLKPSNILVQEVEEEAVPKIIDFGVAKSLDRDLVGRDLVTAEGLQIGTPSYMSPEQLRPTEGIIDTRADVYALGVILHELLVGSRPFETDLGEMATLDALEQRVCEIDPPLPSSTISRHGDGGTSVANQRGTGPESLRRQVREDLDWIVLKALAREPERRYSTVSELIADLERHLRHEPIEAGPPGRAYRWRRFLRRNRLPVAFAAVTFVILAISFVLSVDAFLEAWELNEQSQSRLAELRRHFDCRRIEELVERADRLWPLHPDRSEALEAWLQEARRFAGTLDGHRKALEAFDRSSPSNPGEREWERHLLEGVVEMSDAFVDPEWGTIAEVERRLELSNTILETVVGDLADEAWDPAIAAIEGSVQYGSLRLERQIGLLPLGPDPATGYWEFWHVPSGARPRENPDPDAPSRWLVTEDMGIVFVLLPGGTFLMGSQDRDPSAPNYYPDIPTRQVIMKSKGNGLTLHRESPVHPVTLDPFFISKYELTSGQWQRLSWQERWTEDPRLRFDDLTMPAIFIHWEDTHQVFQRFRMTHPTEARWEYACRAGTSTPWWTGATEDTLQGAANMADRYCYENGGDRAWAFDLTLNDGFVEHAPCGSLRANGFGLHDVHGNVTEWCLDGLASYDAPTEPGTGLRQSSLKDTRIRRGGSFAGHRGGIRSAARRSSGARKRGLGLRVQNRGGFHTGVRPARDVIPWKAER